MASPVTQLRTMAEAIIAQLRLAFPSGSTDIVHLPGIASPRDLDLMVAKQPQSFGVGFVSLTPESASFSRFQANWQILVASSASGSFERRLMGDDQALGLYFMLLYAAAILNRHSIPDVGVLEVTKIEHVIADGWQKDGTALAAIDVRCVFILASAPGFGSVDLPDFLHLAQTLTPFNATAPQPTDLLTLGT